MEFPMKFDRVFLLFLVNVTKNDGKSPCYQWVNQLFLWPFSSSQTVSLPEGTCSFKPIPWLEVLTKTLWGFIQHVHQQTKDWLTISVACATQQCCRLPDNPTDIITEWSVVESQPHHWMPAKLGFNVVKCSFNGMDTNNGYVQIYVLNGYLTNIYIYIE